jgi:hypothetical protein
MSCIAAMTTPTFDRIPKVIVILGESAGNGGIGIGIKVVIGGSDVEIATCALRNKCSIIIVFR